MKSIISFLVAVVICSALFLSVDFTLMKTQGLQLFPENTETKASH